MGSLTSVLITTFSVYTVLSPVYLYYYICYYNTTDLNMIMVSLTSLLTTGAAGGMSAAPPVGITGAMHKFEL